MSYYKEKGQMDVNDRFLIEVGLAKGDSFKTIAKELGRHPSTIAHEIYENRTYIPAQYVGGKDCSKARNCTRKQLCGCDSSACHRQCKYCRGVDCRTICNHYVSIACHQPDNPPYVCNRCRERRLCIKNKYIYVAKHAQAAVDRRRSDSRQGVHLSDEQMQELDILVSELVRKGQPLSHIYAEHEREIPVSLRCLYNYIEDGRLSIKNIDLRRQVRYKQRKRKKKNNKPTGFQNQNYRIGRTYEDFQANLRFHSEADIVEMDTVKGCREHGKRLLTMIICRNSIMLLFLMPDGTADSVKRVFDYLEAGLGIERFNRLFGFILTDNGSEFKRVEQLEFTEDYEFRSNIYFCDPMASWQKPHIEKNHEYIRYVIPRGKSFNPYTQEDITLLMNHINSTKRKSLGGRAPYELIDEDDEDMWELWKLLKMDLIPPDDVHLKPDLFKFNK